MQNNSTVINILLSLSFLSTLSTQIWPELILKYGISNYYYSQWEYFLTFIQFFTGSFIHGDYFHLLFNSLFIFIFGNYVAKIIWEKILTLFFISSVIFIWICLLFTSSWITVWMSWFALALLSFYWCELFKNKNIEYKWAVLAIFLNIAIGFTPGISLMWHLYWALSGLVFFWFYYFFKWISR